MSDIMAPSVPSRAPIRYVYSDLRQVFINLDTMSAEDKKKTWNWLKKHNEKKARRFFQWIQTDPLIKEARELLGAEVLVVRDDLVDIARG